MKMDGLFVQDTGVLENHGTDRRLTTPVGEFLLGSARCAQRIERRRPTRIGFGAPIERRESIDAPALFVPRLAQRFDPEQLERAGERFAEGLGGEIDPCT